MFCVKSVLNIKNNKIARQCNGHIANSELMPNYRIMKLCCQLQWIDFDIYQMEHNLCQREIVIEKFAPILYTIWNET